MGQDPARDGHRTCRVGCDAHAYGDGDICNQLCCGDEDGTGTDERGGEPGSLLSPTYNHLTPALRSGSMVQQEHVHIISAGGNIHTAYPAIFRTLPSITRTCVLAESAVYELSRNPETEKKRAATRNAVSAVKEISATLSIPFSRELVFPRYTHQDPPGSPCGPVHLRSLGRGKTPLHGAFCIRPVGGRGGVLRVR